MEQDGAGLPPNDKRVSSLQIDEARGQASWSSQCDSEEPAAAGDDDSELGRRARVKDNQRASFGDKPASSSYAARSLTRAQRPVDTGHQRRMQGEQRNHREGSGERGERGP
jgi:hypothetical protein